MVRMPKPEFLRKKPSRISQDELDTLEKYLLSDPNYRWKVLQGEHRRTVALILAAQKNKPTRSDLWVGLLEMMFASERAQASSPSERAAGSLSLCVRLLAGLVANSRIRGEG